MENQWVVIAHIDGDLWSQAFNTKEAAEAARRFLEGLEAKIEVIEDTHKKDKPPNWGGDKP